MISRFAGATLGLFAFGVAIVFGLVAGNSFTLVLSRALMALLIFCLIGAAVGAASQAVIGEHRRQREEALAAAETPPAEEPTPDVGISSSDNSPQPMGT